MLTVCIIYDTFLYMIVKRLREIRDKKLLTQVELADLASVTRETISYLEHGQDGQVRTIKRLAEALGVEPQELVEEAGGIEKNPQPK